MMATSMPPAASSDIESDTSGGGNGRVSRLREGWRLHEDEALAQRLQSEEITAHYGGNRQRNHQIRSDLPKAKAEQNEEAERLEVERLQRRTREEEDAEMAHQLQLRDEEQYAQERDLVFAKRLQKMELSHGQPKVPLPRGAVGGATGHSPPSPSGGAVSRRHGRALPPPRVPRAPPPTSRGTPPLPINPLTGDVPDTPPDEDVLPHVRNGVKYNDDQYLVKLARPADVIAEPLYANNKPDHYAVGGAVGGIIGLAEGKGPLPNSEMPTLLLGAAGLSQKDVALSRRAEEQLEQERRDAELAARLQEEDEEAVLTGATATSGVEKSDFEYALELQEREQAKLRRAKERAKEKRRLKKLQQQQQQMALLDPPSDPENDPLQKQIQQSALAAAAVASASQEPLEEDGVTAATPGGHNSKPSHDGPYHRTPPARPDETSPSSMKPPSRRPYVNTDAIDAHQSEFGASAEDDDADEGDGGDGESEGEEGEEEMLGEPEYANVGSAAAQAAGILNSNPSSAIDHHQQPVINLHQDSFGQVTKISTSGTTSGGGGGGSDRDYAGQLIPPYMPLQQQSTKKSQSLEKRIKKKKEKEGCKQQ